MIHIVDYGVGNLAAIVNMYRRLGIEATVAGTPEALRGAERLILPGVGAFDTAMRAIEARGFRPVLDHKALRERIPVLGICLGMQLLTRASEEGGCAGLGWIRGATFRLSNFERNGTPLPRLPHIGWNFVDARAGHPLVDPLPEEPRFYFVHSFGVRCDDAADVLGVCDYAGIRFHAICGRGNIAGAQFHPEKSHRFGMQLLKNFAAWTPGVDAA